MQEGKLVRLGQLADDKLRAKYEDYITVDGIVERRSAELNARQLQLKERISRIDARAATARAIVALFAEYDAAQNTLEISLKRLAEVAEAIGNLSEATHR